MKEEGKATERQRRALRVMSNGSSLRVSVRCDASSPTIHEETTRPGFSQYECVVGC